MFEELTLKLSSIVPGSPIYGVCPAHAILDRFWSGINGGYGDYLVTMNPGERMLDRFPDMVIANGTGRDHGARFLRDVPLVLVRCGRSTRKSHDMGSENSPFQGLEAGGGSSVCIQDGTRGRA